MSIPASLVPTPAHLVHFRQWHVISYAHTFHNVTHGLNLWLAASIYRDEPGGLAVPFLELVAHGILVVTLAVAVGLIASKRRFGKPSTLPSTDSWDEPTEATEGAHRAHAASEHTEHTERAHRAH